MTIAEKALELVEDGSVIGLGTGHAASDFVRLLGQHVRRGLDVHGIATSRATEALAREVGVPLLGLGDVEGIDATFDGADAVDPSLDLIKGLGGALLRVWDRAAGVAFGAGFSDATRQRMHELRWPPPVPLSCLVKPISRRALRRPTWPVPVNRLVSVLALPVVKVVARLRPLREEVQPIRRFGFGTCRSRLRK